MHALVPENSPEFAAETDFHQHVDVLLVFERLVQSVSHIDIDTSVHATPSALSSSTRHTARCITAAVLQPVVQPAVTCIRFHYRRHL